MIIASFDPSKHTGYCWYDTSKHHSAIRCGVMEVPKGSDHYFTGDQIGLKVTRLIRELGKPDFVVLEEQSLAKIGNTSADAMLYPWIATSAIVATISNFGIAYGTIPPATWRKLFFGERFQPPLDNKGKKDWKAAAVAECERLEITLPAQKAISHNAAESCALAICWRGAKLHARRYEPAFLALLQRRNERSAAA
ncbi:hypothetical protein FHT87_005193 [Rhizobium sp. BK316]|uniref:hypothetical protein n=1 Tax=Rhizobium sp. BK316 TaxID=2587053 RepID=UPI001617BAF7|nr:hypothetical protein [Rhizobium sp. BK316]MBB3411240.1 hypothetical protein [Rhizobium sp. BK316]